MQISVVSWRDTCSICGLTQSLPGIRSQEHETTQTDRKTSDAQAPALRASLGETIAKYFTTVRSVKDDQGTFLG